MTQSGKKYVKSPSIINFNVSIIFVNSCLVTSVNRNEKKTQKIIREVDYFHHSS